MISLTINGKKIELVSGFTVLQACEMAGVEIPRFCYHERLAIAGNCRMCLVEIEGGPLKPAASCAMPAADGMVIHTNTPMVEKARKGVMEFLLINHPLDCPICDQGGECDLQDQAMAYGCGNSRFTEYKRSVPKKNFGPLIETAMNRCIHCTRCVRFLSDVGGTKQLGTIGRGEDMEIGTYIEQSLNSELSGNIIDLCPVGALTSKPYSFMARPWELSHTETIDVLDAVGSAIRVDSRGQKVMRILPRLNEEINEEWISDKTRFSYDGLSVQRLDKPYVRKNGKLHSVEWNKAFTYIKNSISGKELAAVVGGLADCESMFMLAKLFELLGSNNLSCAQKGEKFITDNRVFYTFNTMIANIVNADLCLLIGSNPKVEAPIINSRIRSAYLENDILVANVGPEIELTYPVLQLGDEIKILQDIFDEKHDFSQKLKNAKNPMLIVGIDSLCAPDGRKLLLLAGKIAEKYGMTRDDWNGFNVLHQSASTVGALDIGFTSNIEVINNAEVIYLLGADEIDFNIIRSDQFVIYQGHHGDAGAHHADVILPGAAYTEKDGIYVNTEGRAQYAYRAIFPPGWAYDDWQIIKDLADVIGLDLSYSTIEEVRTGLAEISPCFSRIGKILPNEWTAISNDLSRLSQQKLLLKKKNFYMMDAITRSSKVMADCTQEFVSD
ncbi:MAG: NADH-quinone oxidoreductase subunit G [Rickettsiaceae bacterium H1]|nr:NADH-quinone oxidoreductase subunit G [Rickettsiaceae bacterium H1]